MTSLNGNIRSIADGISGDQLVKVQINGLMVECTAREAMETLGRLERRLKLSSLPHRQADLKMRIESYKHALAVLKSGCMPFNGDG